MTADRRGFLSEAQCHDIVRRASQFATGGGDTFVVIASKWTGNVRWARNQVSTSGDVRSDNLFVLRNVQGARSGSVHINTTTDDALRDAVWRAERLANLHAATAEADLMRGNRLEPTEKPTLFNDATYQLDAGRRAAVARELAKSSAEAGMLSSGYLEVSANSLAQIATPGESRYFQFTSAQCSLTVRDPKGIGSGWAGVDWPDWSRIDGPKLAAIALDKCLKSRNPVRIEPGRYVTILEPQAVCDFVSPLVGAMRRWNPTDGDNENQPRYPFGWKDGQTNPELRFGDGFSVGQSKLGQRMFDPRISISSDPMDPDLGFVPFGILPNFYDPFDPVGEAYHAAQWVTNGVLTQMGYSHEYAVHALGEPTGRPNSGAFRMSGGQTSVDEMIATTKRGVLVTRFDRVGLIDLRSQLYRGYTRDGLWLIENGAIAKPVKNLVFTESPLFALNNVDQLGVPQRTFHPGLPWWWRTAAHPVIVPPLKINDFNFSALTDAI